MLLLTDIVSNPGKEKVYPMDTEISNSAEFDLHRNTALNAKDLRIKQAAAEQLGYDGKKIFNQERIVSIAQYIDAESHER